MKHAYMIMTHNNFNTLKEVVSFLDDSRNDIFIHFDKKVSRLPELSSKFSKLVILKDRVDVIWGDVSQIKAEYALFKAAYSTGEDYSYYHLISGTHFPLKSNDELHSWFHEHEGKCILKHVDLTDEEIQMRFGKYHYFLKHLVDKNPFINKSYHWGWRFMLKIQKLLGIHRDTSFIHGKASQWCSLTNDAVKLLLEKEKEAIRNFRRSFCCDEFFVLSVLGTSNIPYIFDDRICHVEFVRTTPKIFKIDDFDHLISTGALFFRKMTDSNLDLAKKIEFYSGSKNEN